MLVIHPPALQVHIGWISKKIPSLQLLARLKIHKTLAEVEAVDSLPLPCRLRSLISSLFTHSIKVSFWNTEMLIAQYVYCWLWNVMSICSIFMHLSSKLGPDTLIYFLDATLSRQL